MKPTIKIIELSMKLCGLGYEKKVGVGDWYLLDGKEVLVAYSNRGFQEWAEKKEDFRYIVIPSLEQGLEWLGGKKLCPMIEERIEPEKKGKWLCSFGFDESEGEAEADTPHEAVLKAMIQVLEVK